MANYGPNDVYSNIPPLDSRGENQLAKFQYWNPDPIGTSDARLAQVHPDLQAVINKAKADNPNLPFVVGSGLRSQADQQNAYKWGWSTVNPNTTKDVNQRGIAADLWPLDSNGKPTFDPAAMTAVGAAIKKAASDLGTPITWGGDWNTFKDRSHFQLNNPSPGYTPGKPLAPGPQPNVDGKTAPPPAPGTPAMSGRGAYDTSPVPGPAGTTINSASPGGPQAAASGGQASYLPRLMQNIAGIESGTWSNPYAALGPVTKSGDRAYGKYQVMGTNIPSWTQEVLGQSMTPLQFAANPDAQEKVAQAKLGQYAAQYGPAGAANMWFTGKPNPNPNITDATATSRGTSAGNYAARAIAGIDNPYGTTLNSVAQNAPVSTAPGTASAGSSGSPASAAATTAAGALGTPGGPALPGFAPAQSNQFLQGASGLSKAMGGQGLQGQQGEGGAEENMRPSPMIGQAQPPHMPNPQAAAQTMGQILNSVRTPLQWGSGTPGSSISATAGPQVPAGMPQGQTAQDLQDLQQQMQQQRLYQMISGGMGTSLNSSSYGGGYG